MHNPKIREIKDTDFQGIHQLIKELAIYELAENEVTTTPETLKLDWEQGFFNCFIIEVEKVIVGICFFNKAYSTWKGKTIYLEDLVVTEELRRKGLGIQLFQYLLDWCKLNDISILRWQVLKWNQLGLDFYKKFNASIDDEWFNGKINFKEGLKNLVSE